MGWDGRRDVVWNQHTTSNPIQPNPEVPTARRPHPLWRMSSDAFAEVAAGRAVAVAIADQNLSWACCSHPCRYSALLWVPFIPLFPPSPTPSPLMGIFCHLCHHPDGCRHGVCRRRRLEAPFLRDTHHRSRQTVTYGFNWGFPTSCDHRTCISPHLTGVTGRAWLVPSSL